ncbi:MAG: FtsK/SpoIIIE domain-containing protein [Desulfobulbia bacterium]
MNAPVMDNCLFSIPDVEATWAFPWGINIANLRHPKLGDVVPGILPTSPGGLLITYDEDRTEEANLLIQHAVVSILTQLPFKMANIHALDFSIKNRFPILSMLEASHLFKTYHFAKDAMAYLELVEQTCFEYHHHYLSANLKSLSDYNQHQQQEDTTPIPYSIIIVNLNDFPTNDETIEKISKLFNSAFDAGFYTIFSFNFSQEFSEDKEDERRKFLSQVQNIFPELELNCEGVEHRITVKDHQDSMELQNVCTAYGLSVEMPVQQETILHKEVQKILKKKQPTEKDFLSVRVGKTPDGRNWLNFQLGEETGAYCAIVIGMTGMGKSTFINSIIMGVARNYTSADVRLWLMDFKPGGSEFTKYKKHPNCEKLVLGNSNISAVTEIIQQFHDQMRTRGLLFEKDHVKDIQTYNLKNPQTPLPYLILIIDEIQNLFGTKSGEKSLEILKKTSKMGRSYGLSIILATQTLADCTLEMTPLLGQFKQRVAFTISGSDCSALFDYNNLAAKQLKRFNFIINSDLGAAGKNIFGQIPKPPKPTNPMEPDSDLINALETIASEREAHHKIMPEIFKYVDTDETTPTEKRESESAADSTKTKTTQKPGATEAEKWGFPEPPKDDSGEANPNNDELKPESSADDPKETKATQKPGATEAEKGGLPDWVVNRNT